MFSFRRRSSKRGQEDEAPKLKSSPSLPKLPSQGIPWPENLVDVNAIHDEPRPQDQSPQGATKTSFQGADQPVSFHKPFRGSPSVDGSEINGGTISSLYMSHPPSAFEIWKSSSAMPTSVPAPPTARPSQRRTRQPPTFNLMVKSKPFGTELMLIVSVGCRWLRHRQDVFPSSTTGDCRYFTHGYRGPTLCNGTLLERKN